MDNWKDIIEPIYEDFEQVSKDQITELEKEIGFTLPKDYADFLSKYACSAFHTKYAQTKKNDKTYIIEVFNGIKTDGYKIAFFWDDEEYQKHSLLPIGANGFGHPFLLNLKNHKIYFIERSPFYAEAEEIAGSFSDFLCNLVFEEND